MEHTVASKQSVAWAALERAVDELLEQELPTHDRVDFGGGSLERESYEQARD